MIDRRLAELHKFRGPHRLLARWVFPVTSPPIERGLIEIHDGVITDVQPSRGCTDRTTIDLGNCAIIPGLVNAHAHLEFSHLREPVQPASPFARWIQNLMAARAARTDAHSDLILNGLRECVATGTTAVGEVATGDWSPSFVQDDDPIVVAFKELIGPLPARVEEQLSIARRFIDDCRAPPKGQTGQVIPALSPHAPFSVCPELFSPLVELARQEAVPLMTHLAETKAELELLAYGTGELRDMMAGFGLWQDGLIKPGTRPIDYLRQLATLPHALIAHGNYLDEEEIQFLAGHPTITTIYCPRTHHFFGHDPHPWQKLLDAGAVVAIGTDGRSSNPDYSLWSELQFLDRLTGGSMRPKLLELGTICGSRALQLCETGSGLAVGSPADICLVGFANSDVSDPWSLLFDRDARVYGSINRGRPGAVPDSE